MLSGRGAMLSWPRRDPMTLQPACGPRKHAACEETESVRNRPLVRAISMTFRLPLLCLFLASSTLSAADWSHWRGPEQNGVARDRNLPDKWSPDPKKADNNLIWT